MTTAAADARFRCFFDDAAVFPPGKAPLARAVADHLARRGTPLGEYVGPLVLPTDQLAGAAEFADGRDLAVSAVVPAGGLDACLAVASALPAGTRVTALELKTAAEVADDLNDDLAAAREARSDQTVWIELPANLIDEQALGLLGRHGVGLKFRTGGLTADLFPSPDTLARVIELTTAAGIPFKLTAGLHRAMRYHDDSTGFDHFGFANVAAATAVARAGGSRRSILEQLQSDDAAAIAALLADDSWRRGFVSFGTCSITEPLATLVDLGLVDANDLTEGHPA